MSLAFFVGFTRGVQILKTVRLFLADEAQSLEFAGVVAQKFAEINGFKQGLVIYLQGELGAGKSFFSRAFIQHFLPQQKVKSPTYTIVESYNFSINAIHHLDLYRLCDPEELEYLAVRELFKGDFVALIEWPQKGQPILPSADLEILFDYEGEGRSVALTAVSAAGEALLDMIRHQYLDETPD